MVLRAVIHAMGMDEEGRITIPKEATNVSVLLPEKYAQATNFFNRDRDPHGGDDGPDAA
jgi:hypothetical protein